MLSDSTLKLTVTLSDGASASIELPMVQNASKEMVRWWIDAVSEVALINVARNLFIGTNPAAWPMIVPRGDDDA